MTYQLQSKTITVSTETLTVWQASNLMDMKRSLLMTEASERWNGREATTIEERAQKYYETFLYPTLVACTTGNLPSFEEFLHSLPAEDTELWEATVRELNQRWLQAVAPQTPEQAAADLEKNG
jgi:hypothetical protein